MKKIFSFLLAAAALVLAGCSGSGIQKQQLKVLYVGGSPNFDTMARDGATEDSIKASAAERTAEWEQFLKEYFTDVKAIDGADYVASMSDEYDVTIFDGKPKPLRKRELIQNEQGRVTDVIPASYLPYDFTRPVICIAEMSEEIGRPLGTKNDWFCLCLDTEAHHWNAEHPIFQGPFPVELHTYMKPTPKSAFEYAPMYGETLDDSCLMFPIQTETLTELEKAHKPFRIGMVSRPNGYTDSPDAEVISSGVCAKSIDAVAIGRHGNFFHWGFAGAPSQLTPEGKVLFANAVVYMAQFAGQHPIARKISEYNRTRRDMKTLSYMISQECYDDYVKMNDEFAQQMQHFSDSLKAVKAAGGKIDPQFEPYLEYTPSPSESREEYVKSQAGDELYAQYGMDVQKYQAYLDENLPYMYYDWQTQEPAVDTQAKSLGIANNDIQILDKCITMLEQNQQPEVARAILERYTLVRYVDPKEWRQWYQTYRDKMFFTEGGGFLWLINDYDLTIPGNDYSVRTLAQDAQKNAPKVGETDALNPVALSASVNKTVDGQKEILLRMKLQDTFHAYCNVVESDPFIPTKIEIQLPQSAQKIGDMTYPAIHQTASGTTTYEGDCLFRQRVSGTGQVTIKVTYQVCNLEGCCPPATKELTVKL